MPSDDCRRQICSTDNKEACIKSESYRPANGIKRTDKDVSLRRCEALMNCIWPQANIQWEKCDDGIGENFQSESGKNLTFPDGVHSPSYTDETLGVETGL